MNTGRKQLMCVLMASVLICSARAGDGPADGCRNGATEFKQMFPSPSDWSFNDTWKRGRIGDREYYFAENGPYARGAGEIESGFLDACKAFGFHQRMITGTLPYRYMTWFDPAEFAKRPPFDQDIIRNIKKHRWPFYSISYVVARDRPPLKKAAVDAMGELWLGDGSAEYLTYRLDNVMQYLRTREYAEGGASANWTDKDAWTRYMEGKLIPALKEELPMALDAKHNLSMREARTLSDLFVTTYFEKIGRAVAWGDYVSHYNLAMQPGNRVVAQRNSDALHVAHGRGIMRTAGGGKIFVNNNSGEWLSRWAGQSDNGNQSFEPYLEEYGFPIDYARTLLFRPFLTGANLQELLAAPFAFVKDVDGDGHYDLTPVGQIARDILDLADNLPERGVPIASVGLLLDYHRSIPLHDYRMPNVSYLGLEVPFEDADYMMAGILRTLFPQHRHALHYSHYTLQAAPYGEIFDVLSPNAPGKKVRADVLENYKILFDLGGLEVDEQFAGVLMGYVESGGCLVMNVADLGEHLPPSFFGVSLSGDWAEGKWITDLENDKCYEEKTFLYRPMTVQGAQAIYNVDGQPLVTRMKVGKGWAVLVGSRYMNEKDAVSDRLGVGRTFMNKRLLSFVPDFLTRMTRGSMPIELRCAAEDCRDLSWWVFRKKESWLVVVMNYNQDRERVFLGSNSTNVMGWHDYKPAEFELACRVPVEDAVDVCGLRHVDVFEKGGKMVARDSVRFGEIRVYELSDRKVVVDDLKDGTGVMTALLAEARFLMQ